MVFQIVVLHSVCMYLLFRLSTRQKGHSRNCRRHRSAKGQNGGLCYIFWPGGWKSVGLFSRNWHARFQNDALQIDSIVLGWDQLLRVTQVKQKKTRENARSQYFFRCAASNWSQPFSTLKKTERTFSETSAALSRLWSPLTTSISGSTIGTSPWTWHTDAYLAVMWALFSIATDEGI